MHYQTLLLDVDGTLLDFKKAEACGIRETFRKHQLYFNDKVMADYSAVNKKCWEEFEQGLLDRETLLEERFRRLFHKYGIEADAAAIEKTYQYELGLGAYLIENAYETCEELSRKCDLYIVTNGVAVTQYRRIRDSGLGKLVKGMFISEEIGYQKPQTEFFDYVFGKIEGFDKRKALMVGDSLSADICGGINAGLDTCWYNPNGLPRPAAMEITYEIRDIRELVNLAG